jgi:hypothetical protein
MQQTLYTLRRTHTAITHMTGILHTILRTESRKQRIINGTAAQEMEQRQPLCSSASRLLPLAHAKAKL